MLFLFGDGRKRLANLKITALRVKLSVVLWGSFASTDTKNLLRGAWSHDYADIVRDNVNKSAVCLGLTHHWVFQHDVITMNQRPRPSWVKSF